eukprot:CAMPEP_0201580996 /NCGR_PEP_ID=MMETSP0190_2-20130828/60438_1 /ASSEMBLY_ACC=CAM_ASM_000263 /TAXON_ID=37353 /ORGANISM="Rosalina sp." /LENGTH=75 /DNA_ID=CAMNT_0048018113 /DNA_START=24 /DNA_END=248 /DNA_ORIENTATION=+
METTPLLPGSSIDPTPTPGYEALRDREVPITDDDLINIHEMNAEEEDEAPKKKWTWKHSLIIWIIVIVAGLLCAV